MPSNAEVQPRSISVSVNAGAVEVPIRGKLSAEGHAVFALRGGQLVEIHCEHRPAGTTLLLVGAMSSEGEH